MKILRFAGAETLVGLAIDSVRTDSSYF